MSGECQLFHLFQVMRLWEPSPPWASTRKGSKSVNAWGLVGSPTVVSHATNAFPGTNTFAPRLREPLSDATVLSLTVFEPSGLGFVPCRMPWTRQRRDRSCAAPLRYFLRS